MLAAFITSPDGMPGQFIKRLPTSAGGVVDVRVREADYRHAAAWDRDIQPVIRRMDRIDAPWKWSTLYLRSLFLELSAGRRLGFLQLVTPGTAGAPFPLGQILLADGFPYPPDDTLACAFLWYLAGAPNGAVVAAGATPCKAILAALVDAAIQFSYLAGYDGRICLHASPAGTEAQRAQLLERYARLGLKRSSERRIGRLRRNDGRYFYADEQAAKLLSSNLQGYR
jgi:hypothetical protein